MLASVEAFPAFTGPELQRRSYRGRAALRLLREAGGREHGSACYSFFTPMASQTHSKGGRPSRYDEKYVDALIEYFEDFLKEPYTLIPIRTEKTYYASGVLKAERVEHKTVAKPLPTLFGFARSIGISFSTVENWPVARMGPKPPEGEKDTRPYRYPAFRSAYKSRVHYQQEYLTTVGLGGVAPPAAYIFTAKNVLGWRDALENRFVNGEGKDVAAAGYVLLPTRKPAEGVDDTPDIDPDPGEGVKTIT